MRELRVLPRFVENCEELVRLAAGEVERFASYPTADEVARNGGTRPPFDPWRDTEYEEQDQYHVLSSRRMSINMRRALLDALRVPLGARRTFYVQVLRYEKGDFVLPHRDAAAQGVVVLTSSERDGLVVQARDDTYIKVVDEAGTLVLCDPRAWHWVDPVLDGPRFSVVTIPPPT